MTAAEHEITIEIICTDLPGTQWDHLTGSRGPVHLGIQKDEEMIEAAPADLKRIVFQPVLRVRRHSDGTPNFLGPFAHGPRAERFVYLVWAVVKSNASVTMVGRIKLHLNHLTWAHIEKAVTKKKPIKVTLTLTNDKGKPVHASVRPDAAKWEL